MTIRIIDVHELNGDGSVKNRTHFQIEEGDVAYERVLARFLDQLKAEGRPYTITTHRAISLPHERARPVKRR